MMENKKENKLMAFWKDESGEIGIKQIAGTVAVIVVLGFAVSFIAKDGMLGKWIQDVWKMFMDAIAKMTGGTP